MIGLPLFAGGVKVTTTFLLPRSTVGRAGASGSVAGIATGADAPEGGPVPISLVAVTVQVYVFPRDAEIVIGDAGSVPVRERARFEPPRGFVDVLDQGLNVRLLVRTRR